ncbi:MAG: hypothetical protein IPM59_08795 [Chloracidobacterium sp.]|nr:hypothetical protein [Chloracidobacterium sp.]
MKTLRDVIVALLFLTIAACTAVSQTRAERTDVDELARRIEDLEQKVRLLTEELVRRQTPAGTIAPAKQTDRDQAVATADSPSRPVKDTPPQRDLSVNVGNLKLTPYGTIYFNAFGNTRGTNNADVPLLASSGGTGGMSASLRQTRLGLKMEGAKVGRARLGAVVEADFFGGSPGIGIGENFGLVRLRLANIRLDWEKTGLTIGQDWMPFAPQSPVSLAAAAIPQMAAAGNNWARIPQVKIERKFGAVAWQGAVLAPQSGDSSSAGGFFLQPNSGSTSGFPFFQSRLAYSGKNWLASKKAGSIGISGHFGRVAANTGPANARYTDASWGIAADWSMPLTDVVSVAGEAFVGQGLGGFQAGVFQGVNPDFARVQSNASTADGIRAIGTRGGWVQIAVTPRMKGNKLGFYGTVGVDDPDDADLRSVSSRDWRTQNLAFAGEVIYKFSPQFQMGIELRRFDTRYRLSRRRTAEHLNLAFAYSF